MKTKKKNKFAKKSKNVISIKKKTRKDVDIQQITKPKEFSVERILEMKVENNEIYFLIKWLQYPGSKNTWEKLDSMYIKNSLGILQTFLLSKINVENMAIYYKKRDELDLKLINNNSFEFVKKNSAINLKIETFNIVNYNHLNSNYAKNNDFFGKNEESEISSSQKKFSKKLIKNIELIDLIEENILNKNKFLFTVEWNPKEIHPGVFEKLPNSEISNEEIKKIDLPFYVEYLEKKILVAPKGLKNFDEIKLYINNYSCK